MIPPCLTPFVTEKPSEREPPHSQWRIYEFSLGGAINSLCGQLHEAIESRAALGRAHYADSYRCRQTCKFPNVEDSGILRYTLPSPHFRTKSDPLSMCNYTVTPKRANIKYVKQRPDKKKTVYATGSNVVFDPDHAKSGHLFGRGKKIRSPADISFRRGNCPFCPHVDPPLPIAHETCDSYHVEQLYNASIHSLSPSQQLSKQSPMVNTIKRLSSIQETDKDRTSATQTMIYDFFECIHSHISRMSLFEPKLMIAGGKI